MDADVRCVEVGGERTPLTPRELDLLTFFMRNPGQAFSRADLLSAVWQSSTEWQDPSTVTVHLLLDQAQRDATLVDLGFGFVVAAVTAFLLGRPVLRDLEQLASAANGIAAGDFETRSRVRRRDEIGVTATAFDEMATALEAATQAAPKNRSSSRSSTRAPVSLPSSLVVRRNRS